MSKRNPRDNPDNYIWEPQPCHACKGANGIIDPKCIECTGKGEADYVVAEKSAHVGTAA